MPDSNNSVRTVKCVKLQKDLPGLDEPPGPAIWANASTSKSRSRLGTCGKNG